MIKPNGTRMFIILAILLTAAALLAVAYPILFKGSAAKQPTTAEESLDELLAQRDAAMQALRELNFDHRMGKISDEDFAAFELNLKQNAAGTLRALDQWEAQADDALDRDLEHEIAARRAQLTAGAQACPACGHPATAADRFCAICGAALFPAPAPEVPTAARVVCSRCGRPAEPGDRFCGGCGQSLR
jgi:hypothetical protein